jgi:hypothetical protein
MLSAITREFRSAENPPEGTRVVVALCQDGGPVARHSILNQGRTEAPNASLPARLEADESDPDANRRDGDRGD